MGLTSGESASSKEEETSVHKTELKTEKEEEEEEDYCLGFVFEDWLDPQLFTNHGASEFSLGEVTVLQGTFCHTESNDQTGAVVWDDAVMLLRHLVTQGNLEGKKVIDLGAGTGFLGIALGVQAGANSIVSDRSVMMPLVEENVKRNTKAMTLRRGSCKALSHSWGEPLGEELDTLIPFDVVLASGCIYHEEANPLLIKSLQALSSAETRVYIAIDFRFDVSEKLNYGEVEDEDAYMSPVLKSFFTQARAAGITMRAMSEQELGLTREQIKNSVKIFLCNVH